MSRKIAIALAVALMLLAAWGVMSESPAVKVIVDGQEIGAPWRGALGVGGVIVAFVASLCAATLLLFVFAGMWIILVGLVILAGIVFIGGISPLFLPLLIPIAVVWAFIALLRHKN